MKEKCSPDDPCRCQAVTPHGQCQYLASEGDELCDFHNHGAARRKSSKQEVERYILDNHELRDRYERQQSDEDYLNLRKDICLLRALMEKRANMLKTDADYMMGTNAVLGIAQRLESMNISLLKLRQASNTMLGVDQLKAVALQIAEILSEELRDVPNQEEIIERIGQRIFEALEEIASGQHTGEEDNG